MNKLSTMKSILGAIVRSRTPVQFADWTRIHPISGVFGLDRGTPIDRYYIDKFISANADAIVECALEVGEIKYLRLYGARTTQKCILVPESRIAKRDGNVSRVIICDLNDCAGLYAGQFDCFVCTQTLQFIYNLKTAIQCAFDLLAAGGTFIGTVPGISQISRYDMDRWGDYWRFTTRSMQRVLQDVFGTDVYIQSYGNVAAAQAFLLGMAVEELPDPALLDISDEDYQVIIGFRARKQ